MDRIIILISICLTFAATALVYDVDRCGAEPQMTTQSPAPTLNFRDPNNRMKMHNVTQAQRLEAAKRAAARKAAAKQSAKSGSVAAPTAASPQNTEGGAK